ncbi:hypothetical protein Rs2_35031 [Raphanus sativus]|nr:hypothetical protein Rs2_35031 [Raphanus sativus]
MERFGDVKTFVDDGTTLKHTRDFEIGWRDRLEISCSSPSEISKTIWDSERLEITTSGLRHRRYHEISGLRHRRSVADNVKRRRSMGIAFAFAFGIFQMRDEQNKENRRSSITSPSVSPAAT